MSDEGELARCVRERLEDYFHALNGETPGAVYEMVIASVERPLLEEVLRQAGGNQSRAADWLGINRNTLRKKLKQHGIE